MIVDSTSSAAMAAYSSTATRSTSAVTGTTSTDTSSSEDSSASVTSVSVDLSSISTSYSQAITQYSAYFPVREGMSSDALALGVAQPGAVSSSKDKTFAEVGDDARKRMDEKYALMKSGGKAYDGSDTDRNSLLGDLDRRSLNAVATNAGGQFSNEEQAAAKALMRQQEKLAFGYYSGPADQAQNFTDPYANDPVGRAKAALAYLNSLSPEEKATSEWLNQHQSLTEALAQSSSQAAPPAQDTTHFQNLSEILADTDSDGSGQAADDGSTSYVYLQVQAQLQAAQ